VRINQNIYAQYRGLVVVRDENYREIATLLVPKFGAPLQMGATLKRLVSGHFYFPTEFGANDEPTPVGAVWANTMDFAAWLTGYLKFYGSRRRRLGDRTGYNNEGSVELLPTGMRPDAIDYVYVLRPQASRTKPGVHLHLTIVAKRGYNERNIFDTNLHALEPAAVQTRGYEFIELGR
jgi:hypothetical protein